MLVQQGRSSAMGKLTAWTEGGYPPSSTCPGYMYEIILGTYGAQWSLTSGSTIYDPSICPPLAYTKVAFAYLALYGENAYTLSLVNAVKNLATSSSGFGEATLENGQSALSLWGSPGGFYSDNTNEFVLAAANHVIGSTLATLTTGVDSGVGSGSASPNCPGPNGCSTAVNSPVSVQATPASGWQFSSWSVTGALLFWRFNG